MRIKSYYVKSIEEAMNRARTELGEDALLLNTRKESLPDDGAPGYQVVFGCDGEAEGTASAAAASSGELEPAAPSREAPAVAASIALSPLETGPRAGASGAAPSLEWIRSQLNDIHDLLLSTGRPAVRSASGLLLQRTFARLTRVGFSPTLAGSIVDGLTAALASEQTGWDSRALPFSARALLPGQRERVSELLREEISARVKIDPEIGVPNGNGCVAALVGPGGAGKTTTLMKIAAFQAGPGRPVRILTLDSSGLASRMQLQLFARRNNVAFQAVEKPETLPVLVEEARRREIVLIDTPSHQTAGERENLASIVSRVGHVDVHVVLPGYMSAGACREAFRKYQPFGPSKLIVTRLDETTEFGTLVSEAVREGLRLSLVADGVAIPESLHALSADYWVAAVLGPEMVASAECA